MSRLLALGWYKLLTRWTGPALCPLVLSVDEVPKRGPLVIVSSHVAWTDHLVLGTLMYLLRGQRLVFLSHVRFHRSRAVRALLHQPMRSLPVGGNSTQASLASCVTSLARGGAVCIYPTGRLQVPTEPGSFRRGAFLLAEQARAAVLCVGMVYVNGEPGRWLRFGPAGMPNLVMELIGSEQVAALGAEALRRCAEQRVVELERQARIVGVAQARQAAVELETHAQYLREVDELGASRGVARNARARAARLERWGRGAKRARGIS